MELEGGGRFPIYLEFLSNKFVWFILEGECFIGLLLREEKNVHKKFIHLTEKPTRKQKFPPKRNERKNNLKNKNHENNFPPLIT